jgi:methionine sulfoxide reductase heme-binding subunit
MTVTTWLDRRSTPILLGALAGIGAIAAALLVTPIDAEQANLAARWTARTALPLFLIAYLAGSLARLYPAPMTHALRRRRRQWGLGFALAHIIHLGALAVNVLVFGPERSIASLIPGGIAYGLIVLMAATSSDAAMRRMGRSWHWLHLIGIHYIWFIFFASYAKRIPDLQLMATGLIFTPVMLAALALRLYGSRKERAVPATV